MAQGTPKSVFVPSALTNVNEFIVLPRPLAGLRGVISSSKGGRREVGEVVRGEEKSRVVNFPEI